MKKLIVGIALVACALSAQATKVTWGLSSGVFDATKFTAGTMYLVYATDATAIDWTAFEGQSSFTASTIASAGFDKTIDTFAYSSTSISKTSTITPSSAGISGSQSFYVLCISEAADYVAYSPTAQTASISTSTMTLNKTQLTSAFSYTQAVPEPTSGLLLLIGVAGLALKRKRI